MGTRLLKAGDVWRGGFGLRNPAGASQAADAPPTATLCRNGTDDGTVTVTVTQISGGRYKWSLTVPGTYAAGDQLDLWVSATVAGQSDADVVDSCRLVGLDSTSANWPADLRGVAGDAAAAVVNANHLLKVAAYDAAGTPLANVTLPSLYPANVTQWGGVAVGGAPNSGVVRATDTNGAALMPAGSYVSPDTTSGAALLLMTTGTGGGRAFTAGALAAAPGGAPPEPTAVPVTIRLTQDGTPSGVPVADAEAWVTATSAPAPALQSGDTASDGTIRLLLRDGGVYYLWAAKDGWVGCQGVRFTARAD